MSVDVLPSMSSKNAKKCNCISHQVFERTPAEQVAHMFYRSRKTVELSQGVDKVLWSLAGTIRNLFSVVLKSAALTLDIF